MRKDIQTAEKKCLKVICLPSTEVPPCKTAAQIMVVHGALHLCNPSINKFDRGSRPMDLAKPVTTSEAADNRRFKDGGTLRE
jgi:hypothetical protein